jgi:hypothetical protein
MALLASRLTYPSLIDGFGLQIDLQLSVHGSPACGLYSEYGNERSKAKSLQ